MHDFEYKGAAELPYDPRNYGLPIWRDKEMRIWPVSASRSPQHISTFP